MITVEVRRKMMSWMKMKENQGITGIETVTAQAVLIEGSPSQPEWLS